MQGFKTNSRPNLKPKRLVFTGGGTRCLVFVDALMVLERAGLLTEVVSYWGTSAGAFIATLLAVGSSVSAVRSCMRETDYIKFRDVDVNNLFNINKTWGLDNGESLMREVERILEIMRPGASEFLMSDCPQLTIVISDLTDHTMRLCSAATYPGLRVVEAIRASMSLPLFFRPYIHRESGHIWVDGAVGANFPWSLLGGQAEKDESLGFTFDRGSPVPTTLSEYLFSMIHFQEPKKIQDFKRESPHNILWFPQMPFPSWFMRLQPTDFEMIATIGRNVAETWLINANSAHSSCSPNPPETSESSLPCEDHHSPPQSCPPHHTEGTSGSQKSSGHEWPRGSSLPQSPVKQQTCRRWSW